MVTGIGGRRYAGQTVEDRQRARRERFLDAGLTMFARDGYANTSVGSVCKSAGLSSRQFYEEFSGREALMIELIDLIESASRTAVSAALAASSGLGVRQLITDTTRAYLDSVAMDPRRARVLLVEAVGASPSLEKYRAHQRSIWSEMLQPVAERFARRGEIPAGDYAMRVSAMVGAVSFVVYDWSVADPQPPLDDVIRVLVQTLIGVSGA